MGIEKLKNCFIGISKENGNYYIESIDLKNNINKELLKDFLFDKDNINELKKEKYIGFCFKCNKNINNSFCGEHPVKYFKDIIKEINVEEIENNLTNITEKFNNYINILEEKIKALKKRNEEQILLARKIINTYNSVLKSDNLTYQILSNFQNILQFNEINKNFLNRGFDTINFEYNILKEFPINTFINEKLSIEKIQNIIKLNLDIKKFLFLEKKNKIIFYSDETIYLFNLKNFAFEDQINSGSYILALNLMKDKETILVSHGGAIRKLNIEDNKMKLENYLLRVHIDEPGIIINYKNELAWTMGSNIGFSSKQKYYVYKKVNDFFNQRNIYVNIINIFQYDENSILYVYLIKEKYNASIFFNQYENGESKNRDIFLEGIYYSNIDYTYKIYDLKSNKIIIFGNNIIYIIDIFDWKIINKINNLNNSIIINSYNLDNFYFILFNKEEEENKIIFMKINENYNNIINETYFGDESSNFRYFLFYYNNNNKSIPQMITIKNNQVNIYDIINMRINKKIKKNLNIKKKNHN